MVSDSLPNTQFIIFGDGPLRERVMQLVDDNGLAEKFIFPGNVSGLPPKLTALDLFLLTSESEALPNVLVESQAYGVPVLAPDVGGIRETMDIGTTGKICASDEAVLLAETAINMRSDDEWLRKAAQTAPGFARTKFSTELMMERFVKVLEPT